MWLYTRYGNYSVVRDRRNSARVIVRSRGRQDLSNLATFIVEHKLLSKRPKVRHTSDSDYEWRIVLNSDTWAEAMSELAYDMDYGNFKEEMHRQVADGKLSEACMDILYDVYAMTYRGYARMFGIPIH